MGVLAKPIPFGDYFLLEKLNTGGMAEVYKAKTFGVEGFERIVAVKKILPSIAEDKEFISMFIDEAKITAQLTHANIAQVYELGNIDDDYYIALEYVSGHDLRVIYDRCVRTNQKLDIGCVCYIMSEICKGLDYAHNKKDANGEPMNIIHRDISPQNILISYEGDCKLIDFGIAKATNKSSATQVGILKGKFSYMSPEQVSGKTNIDRRSDIFAMGIVLFEMLTLKRLFLGSSDFETLEKIRKVEVSPPTLYNSDIPEELEDIVLKALEKDVSQRYQTAAELQEALQRFMFKQNIYYTAKDLSEFMSSMFAQEIALEQKKMEFYKELTCEVLAQSKKPSATPEDETAFYEKQNIRQMSGVQYESVSAQPAPKQAIYAELDDFQPPSDNIVYSPKASQNNNPTISLENVNDIVSAPVTAGKPHPVARKSSATLEPVVVKNRETMLTSSVPEKPKKKNSKHILVMIVVGLFLIVALLLGVLYGRGGVQQLFDKHNGQLHFAVYPDNVVVNLEINNEQTESGLGSSFDVGALSTASETHYRITAEGYKPFEGSILADADGEIVEAHLQPAVTTKLKLYVTNIDGARVTVDDIPIDGDRNFEVSGLTPGEHFVRVQKDGYKTEEKIFAIRETEQKSLTFELKPAVVALLLKTTPYEASYKLTNLRTGEFQTGRTDPNGQRITDLPADDKYSITIYDGRDTIETMWVPQVRNLPNEDQERVFSTKTNPNAEPASDASAQAAAQAPARPKTEPRPKADAKESPEPARPKPAEEKKTEAPPAGGVPGILQIAGKPPCNVSINGKSYGTTPKKIEMPANAYTIRCVNEEQGIDNEQSVTLGAGEVKKVMFK
ncbi:MAG: protein kinase [Proteobacteria bacterium]|nr:protein kinase [Pseudomonadota bacterium]